MNHSPLRWGWLGRVSGPIAAWMVAGLVLFVAACTSSPAAPAPSATGDASAKTAATAAPKAATTASAASPTGAAKATTTGATPAPQATLVEPKELAGKGNPNAKVTIIEFSDFQ